MISTIEISTKEKESFVFSVLFFAIWFMFPVISIFLFIALLYVFNFNKYIENLLLFLVAISFGLVAYTTKSIGTTDSDIQRYYFIYSYIAGVDSIQKFLVSFVVDGGNNVLFYIITFLMTRLFPDNPQVMPLFWVSVTYFFSFLTIKEYKQYFSLPHKTYILVIFFSCLGIITFYTTTEIIKQTASVAIIGYAIILKIRKKRISLFYAIVSVLIHFSSFLLVPVYYLCNKKRMIKYMPVLFVICLALSFFNFNVLAYEILSLFMGRRGDLLKRVAYYEDIKTWTISLRFYAVFAVYLLLTVIFYWDYFITKTPDEKKEKQSLLVVHSLAFFILLVNRNNVHNFIRYVLGYFPFYIVAVLQLFTIRIARYDRQVFIILILLFYVYSNVKMLSAQTTAVEYADSYMNNNVFNIITSNVIQFLQFQTVNK